jgi:hypothetical protein
MDLTRPKLTDVENAFDRLPEKGPRIDQIAGRVLARGRYSHVQGVVAKEGHYLFTHADEYRESGRLLIASRDNLALSGWTTVLPFTAEVDEPFYPHAGGCQSLGNLLVVACETIGKAKRSVLAFLDVTNPGQPVELERLRIPRGVKAMAAGLTVYTREGAQTYLVAAYEHGKVDLYWSSALTGEWSQTRESLTVREKGHQAFLLFTDRTESVFAIGLNHSVTEWDWSNWALLYRLHFDADGAPRELERLARKTFRTHDGAALRWGAAIEAASSTKLVLHCTEKNFDKRRSVLNVFDPDTPAGLRATGSGTITFTDTSTRSRGIRSHARRSSSKKAARAQVRAARTTPRATPRARQR